MTSLLDLDCNKEEVKRFVADSHLQPVTMSGMVNDLQKIKVIVKDAYERASYMTYDIEYHGWEGEAAKNMHEIEREIVRRLKEVYALCLAGLGETPK